MMDCLFDCDSLVVGEASSGGGDAAAVLLSVDADVALLRRLRALAMTNGQIAATVAIEAAPSRFCAGIVPLSIEDPRLCRFRAPPPESDNSNILAQDFVFV